MISKTLSGVSFVDDHYGGVYAGRSFLVCGRSGTGKTAFGLQFTFQGLRQDDRCLILSTLPANDLTILAESLGFSLGIPIDLGHLILLEYNAIVPGRSATEWNMLPPEGYDQLREIIEANSIRRVVLDTILPWVATPKLENIAEHVFSFVRSFDRLGVTTMMTLPKPVSSAAFRLKKALDDVVPISILLTPTTAPNRFIFQITKYLGEKLLNKEDFYSIERGIGLSPARDGEAQPARPPTSVAAKVAPPLGPLRPAVQRVSEPLVPSASAPADGTSGGIRLSRVVPIPATPPPQSQERPAQSPPAEQEGQVRLAKIWKPEMNVPAPEKT